MRSWTRCGGWEAGCGPPRAGRGRARAGGRAPAPRGPGVGARLRAVPGDRRRALARPVPLSGPHRPDDTRVVLTHADPGGRGSAPGACSAARAALGRPAPDVLAALTAQHLGWGVG